MTVTEFKIWLIRNNYTQKSLAKTLSITERTIGNYIANERFPFIFVLALVCIQKGLTVKDLEL